VRLSRIEWINTNHVRVWRSCDLAQLQALGRGINLDITDAGRTVVEMICEKMTILDDEREREVDTRVVKEIQNLHLQAR